MLCALLLFCLLYEAHCKPTSLKGKVDIDKDLASIFQDIIGHYLNENPKNNNNEININKVVGSFNDFARHNVEKINSSHGSKKENTNIRIANVTLDPGDDTPKAHKNSKKSNLDSDDIRVTRYSSDKSREKQRGYTQGITDEKYKSGKKRKTKNKSDRKEHGRKRKEINTEKEHKKKIRQTERENKELQEKINASDREYTLNKEVIRDTGEEKDEKEGTRGKERDIERKQKETKDANSDNKAKQENIKDVGGENGENSETSDAGKGSEAKSYENKDIRVSREKTVLEEMIGMLDSLHIYGNHKDDKHGLPLNNITT